MKIKPKETLIIEVSPDGRGGEIYSKPDSQQEANIRKILEKANKELEEMDLLEGEHE